MRAAAILGLGCSAGNLKPFQTNKGIDWRMGLPACAEDADVILLFGGDGTIHRHLGQLVELGLPVLIIPAGSGNDFARALGLGRVRDSLRAWEEFGSGAASVRAIDLGTIFGGESAHEASAGPHRYFCSVAGVGLDSEVARRANDLPRWLRGHGGYALSLAPAILNFAPMPMKISTAAEETSGGGWTIRSNQATLLAAFANTPLYGGGMRIAPEAEPDDGLLDVCVIGGMDPFKLFCLSPTVYLGRHLKIKEVNYFRAARVRIETEHPLDVYADGEYVCHTPVEFGVKPESLRVVTTSP